MNTDPLAPPIKQKAKFKIKDAKCHLSPRNKEKHRDSSKQNIQDSCNIDCVREKMKQKLQSAMRTLRKSINKQQFYIQFSGTDYEVAQKPSRIPEGSETCSTGQVFQDGKCGKSGVHGAIYMLLYCHQLSHRRSQFSTDGFQPCQLCPLGSYQPEPGRVLCFTCGGGLMTKYEGSVTFRDCETKG
ncbi:hypothetical protein GOODEAATRI_016916 [Goodea atripinnis]|uniref:Tyrosine-protein kinase ephrin type A/B receptor-like domain-containing protein n=1 Tax=Goodea atripinnis TaxID=208336 RepID=A0ABV0PEY6_9TELE